MPSDIYSDIWGEVLIPECGGIRVYLYDKSTFRSSPLIIPNRLAVEKLRDYLNEVLKEDRK